MSGIYIHIPFCIARCRYCDFVSFADHSDRQIYLEALSKEQSICREVLPTLKYDTVFIGGGTPSCLPEGDISRILEDIFRKFHVSPNAEITIESNPGTLNELKLREYRSAGINRISMGLQSADNQILKNIGRIHSFGQFLESFSLAREVGFNNINADIMYGLPEQTVETHLDTIRKLAELSIEHISAYSLILEENTPLYTDVNGGAQSLPDEDAAYEMHRQGIALLGSFGYGRYEISNYSKPGFQSRHNLNYWNNGEYLGLGLNSHSAMHIDGKWLRWSNTARLADYISASERNDRFLTRETQEIPKEEEIFETVMLGFRKTEGICDNDFYNRFGMHLKEAFPQAIKRLEEKGWLVENNGFLMLTDEGLDFQNLALLEMM